jgi:hypothetical protein
MAPDSMILLGYLFSRSPKAVSADARDDRFCNGRQAGMQGQAAKFIVFVPQLTQCGEPESVMNERSINGIARSWILQGELSMNPAAAHVVGLSTWARSSI